MSNMNIPVPESITREQFETAMRVLGFEKSGRIAKLEIGSGWVLATVEFRGVALGTHMSNAMYADIPIPLVKSAPAAPADPAAQGIGSLVSGALEASVPAAKETCTCGCAPR